MMSVWFVINAAGINLQCTKNKKVKQGSNNFLWIVHNNLKINLAQN